MTWMPAGCDNYSLLAQFLFPYLEIVHNDLFYAIILGAIQN